jgi:quercetin dioxygenase-like cupin family protein
MEMAELWDDGNCSAKVARMVKGKGFGMHRHDTWIMVYVISGKVQIMPDGTIVEGGGFYYVEPGTEHDDVCIEDNTMVLVIRDEPNKQYPVAGT